ncbi:MAG: hypothetical protein ACK5V3_02900 [Bdellovibrionales bacterium]
MKNLVKKFKKSKELVNNERGQGMLEYILLVVVIVGLVFAAKGFLGPKMEEIQGQLGERIGQVLGGG